ncbi:MAG: S-layer homology domain-containing protein, partial [Oscillospiraceae bacterium]|nr:S-layer homology domain-containing protein [Oscillospiraceae bacterium]
ATAVEYIKETEEELNRTDNPYGVFYKETSTMTELYDSKTNAVSGGNYSISTGDELGLLSMYVQEGYSTRGANFYLTGDIDLTTQGIDIQGAGWTPIGTTINRDQGITTITYFRGNFDGCGYTITGLYIVSDFIDMAGLFGQCWGSTIKNVGVAGEILGDDEVGGIVGRANECTIVNCWSSVMIQASTEVGSICGYAKDTTIENCGCYGPLYTTSDEGESSGIVGKANGATVKNCYHIYGLIDGLYNEADTKSSFTDCMYFKYNEDMECRLQKAITVDSYTGDELLQVLNAWVYLQDCELYCSWHIASTVNEIPGANGYFPVLTDPSVITPGTDEEYCGDYTAENSVSGLYSTRSDGKKGACYSISGMDDLVAFRKYVNEGYETSGIIFFMTRDVDMSYMYSRANGNSWTPVGTATEPFRGIFDAQGYTIKNLYISSSADDQALFGKITGANAVVKNLGISGSVTGKGVNTAAICADFNFATIANCWSMVNVAGAANTGGIIGGGNMGSIVNCTNYGVIAGATTYGAIAGAPVGTSIRYCYYLYASCQQAFPTATGNFSEGVQSFNGSGAVCVLADYVTVEGTKTKNALTALKLYVDAHYDINYCTWTPATSQEYYEMGVVGFPVLISASNTMGSLDKKVVQAYFNGEEFYSVLKAVNAANDYPGGGTVTLAINAQLKNRENLLPDDDVRIDTDKYTLIIMSSATVSSLNQLEGYYIVKEGGTLLLKNGDGSTTRFMYSKKNADPSCNAEFYGVESLNFRLIPVKDKPWAYNMTLLNGEFIVNPALEGGNPHGIPADSRLTIEKGAVLNVASNARIRTTGGAEIYNYGGLKIGNAVLDRNTGVRMAGVFEDDNGLVTLPYIYKDGYYLRGWTDGTSIYPAGSKVDVQTTATLTAAWAIGDKADPYPGDDYYDDGGEPIYNIPISIIQSEGGKITPGSLMAAKGETLTCSVTANPGYYIKNVLVDGESVQLDENGRYSFVSISRPHSMVVLFAKTANIAYSGWRNPFTDVSRDDWCYDYIRYVNSAGLFGGTTETTFSPNAPMTREMVVAVLWRMSGKPEVPGADLAFKDVAKSSYAYEAIKWANAYGIVMGFSADRFGYGETVTREQFITFLFRYAKNYSGDEVSLYDTTNILGYTDVMSISRGMSQAFQWGVGAGIISGSTPTTLSPKATATRAQVAAMLTRYSVSFMDKYPAA